MTFHERKTPLVSTSENTLKRLISYHMAVWFVVLVTLILQLFTSMFFQALLQIISAVVIAFLLSSLLLTLKKQRIKDYKIHMKSITDALLVALLLPVMTPIYVVLIAVLLVFVIDFLFARFFRKAIINPVLLSVLLISLIFANAMIISDTMASIFQESTLSLGTFQFWFGSYEGVSLGSSAFIILGLLWIYLSVTRIIHFKMGLWFIVNMAWFILIYALFTDYTLWYLFTNLILGHTIFALVFLVAEPIATPQTKEMMIIYPFLAVIITIWFRLQFDIVQAAIFALVFAQFLSWLLEQFQQRSSKRRIRFTYGIVLTVWLATLLYHLV